MLTDPTEIAIIAGAKQAGVRDPNRSRAHFHHIMADHLRGVPLAGRRLLDIGPGQFDFGVIAREAGAEVVGVDRDPAVLELGRHKGFTVVDGDLRTLTRDALPGRFDGIFCKFSLNAFWFRDDAEAMRAHLATFFDALTPTAWGWVSPWNGLPRSATLTEADINRTLALQRALFGEAGFRHEELTVAQARRYGVNGRTADRSLFVRNLPRPMTNGVDD